MKRWLMRWRFPPRLATFLPFCAGVERPSFTKSCQVQEGCLLKWKTLYGSL
jgi:hypothetical protein